MTDVDKVTMLFATAGVTPSPDELTFFTNTYPVVRMMADMLYTVDAATDEEPGLVFNADPFGNSSP